MQFCCFHSLSYSLPYGCSFLVDFDATLAAHSAANVAIKWVVADKELMVKDPKRWRLKLQGWLPHATKAERSQARSDAKSKAKAFHKTYALEADTHREGELKMNEKHFVKHFRKWELDEDVPNAEGGIAREESVSFAS